MELKAESTKTGSKKTEEIQQCLEEKYQFQKSCLTNTTCNDTKQSYIVRGNVELKLGQMQDTWLSIKADEIQQYADKHDMKSFYNALKEVYGPTPSGASPLLSADGTMLITDKVKILERWAEHFQDVLNSPSVINDAAISRLPQIPINTSLNNSA